MKGNHISIKLPGQKTRNTTPIIEPDLKYGPNRLRIEVDSYAKLSWEVLVFWYFNNFLTSLPQEITVAEYHLEVLH